MNFDNDIDNVRTRERNDQHGDLKNSAAYLYRNYKAWWKLNKGTPPMTFKKWIEWAKDRGLVKKYNSDGSPTPKIKEDEITYGIKRSANGEIEKVKNTGRTIAKFIIGVSIIMVVLSFVKLPKKE